MINVEDAFDVSKASIPFTEVVLTRTLAQVTEKHPFNAISMTGLRMESYLGTTTLSLAIKMYKYLESEEVGKHCVTYPRDWWQYFKQRWFPVWLRKRYPVQYKSEKFEMGVLYPEFKPGLTGKRTIVYYKAAG